MRNFFAALLLLTAVAGAASAHGGDERVRTAPVTVAGAPRSLVTLVVSVPADIEQAAGLRYEVIPTGAVDIMGRMAGSISDAAGNRARPVLLTLRIPSDALVGLLDVADVVFTTADGRVYEVPIILRVPAVRALRIEGVAELSALERGDQVDLAFRLRNLGNDTEPLALQLIPPRSWRGGIEATSVIVPAYGEEEIVASLRVPLTSGAGDHVVRLLALRVGAAGDTTVVADARAVLRVRQEEPRLPGLVLRPTLGAVASRGSGLVAAGLALDGPLVGDVRLRAQYSPASQAQGSASLGLASLGGLFVPFGASLEAPDWRVDLGTLQAQLGDLAGVGFIMDGARARVRRGNREYIAFAARPAAQLRAEGHLAGVGVWQQTRYGRVGATVSSLREERAGLGSFSRALTSVGADFVSNPIGDHTLSAGLAFRSAEDVTGVGLRSRWEWRRDRNELRASLLHAPGGSRGFAIATTQFELGGRRALNERLSVDGQVLTSRDDGSALRELSRWSASAGATYALTSRTTLSSRYVEADAAVALTQVGAQSFGSRQRTWMNTAETRRGEWTFGTDLVFGQIIRRATLFSGAESERGAAQQSVELRASRRLQDLGQLSFGTQLQQSGAGVGLAQQTRSAFARWSEVPLMLGGTIFRASTEARLIDSEFQRGFLKLSARVATSLRNGTEIAAVAERNPFLRDAQGRALVVFGLRVSASTEVLAAGRLAEPGLVFEDANGNGRRDAGERGVGGVTVTHGSLRFTTNRDGEYRIPSNVRGDVRLDARTLPHGYVVHPGVTGATTERRDFPLVPTGQLQARFVAVADSAGRVPTADLSLLDVWMRGSDGTEWVGRSVGGGSFVFENIPVGQYELRTAHGRLGEMVLIEPTPITLRATPGQTIEVPVRARALRVITPPRGNGGRGGVAPRGAAPRVAPRGAAPQLQPPGGA